MDNIMKIMMEAKETGTTLIVITHDMNLVAQYADKILVMDEAEVVFFGSKGDFFRDYSTIKSETLVLPEIYELAQILRGGDHCPVPEVYSVEAFVSAVEVA